jgi:hypothetical protein
VLPCRQAWSGQAWSGQRRSARSRLISQEGSHLAIVPEHSRVPAGARRSVTSESFMVLTVIEGNSTGNHNRSGKCSRSHKLHAGSGVSALPEPGQARFRRRRGRQMLAVTPCASRASPVVLGAARRADHDAISAALLAGGVLLARCLPVCAPCRVRPWPPGIPAVRLRRIRPRWPGASGGGAPKRARPR